MTVDQSVLIQYIRDRADQLGLKDWTVELGDQPPMDEDALAELHPTEGRKWAVIRICSHFGKLSPEEQRSAIIHELLHCHQVPILDIVRLDLYDARVIPASTYDILHSTMRRAAEYENDALCEAISPMFPLIPWEETNLKQSEG